MVVVVVVVYQSSTCNIKMLNTKHKHK